MLAVIVVLIAVQIWNSTFRQGSTGQSWGKQVAKTRLIDEWTGRPLGGGKSVPPPARALVRQRGLLPRLAVPNRGPPQAPDLRRQDRAHHRRPCQ